MNNIQEKINKFIKPPKTSIIRCQMVINRSLCQLDRAEDEMKFSMARRIAEHLIKSDLIEFTVIDNTIPSGEFILDAQLKVISPYNELKLVL